MRVCAFVCIVCMVPKKKKGVAVEPVAFSENNGHISDILRVWDTFGQRNPGSCVPCPSRGYMDVYLQDIKMCVCVCVCVFIYTYTYTTKIQYIYIYIYMYVCIYIYILVVCM